MFLLALLGILFAPNTPDQNADLNRLWRFRAGSLATLYPSQYSSLSGFIAWTPLSYEAAPISILGNTRLSAYFPQNGPVQIAPETGLLFRINIGQPWSFETGPGLQYWFQSPLRVYLSWSAHLAHSFETQKLGILDEILFGYSYVNTAPPNHEFKLMVGFRI